MFHSVPPVPRAKMERFASMNTKLALRLTQSYGGTRLDKDLGGGERLLISNSLIYKRIRLI